MNDDAIVIPVEIDLSRLDELENALPAAAKAAGQKVATALGDGFERGKTRATKALDDLRGWATRSMNKIEAKAKDAANALDNLGKTGQKVGKLPLPGFQQFGNLLDDVAEGVLALLTPTGLAIGAVVGLGVAITGAVVAPMALAAGIAYLVASTDDLLKSLEPFQKLDGFAVKQTDVDRVNRANAAMESLGVVGKRVLAIIGVEAAPYVERTARLLVAMGLMAVDGFNKAAEGTDMFAKALSTAIADNVDPFGKSLLNLLDTGIAIWKWMGKEVPESVQKARDKVAGFHEAVGNMGVNLVKEGFLSMEHSMGAYINRADVLITTQDKVNDGVEKTAKATSNGWDKKQTGILAFIEKATEAEKTLGELMEDNATKTWNTEVDSVIEKYDGLIDRVKTLIELGADRAKGDALIVQYTADMNRELEDVYQKQDAILAKEDTWGPKIMAIKSNFDKVAGAVSAIGDGVTSLAMIELKRLHDTGKAQGAAAEVLWAEIKALSIAQTTALAAVASMQALAQLGPVAGPIAVAGIIMGAAGSAITTIMATQPEFDIGTGYAQRQPGQQSDQFTATVSEGEGILTRQGVQLAGGPDAVNAMNAGMSPSSGPSVLAVSFRDRHLDYMMVRTVQSGGEFAAMLSPGPRGVATVYT